MSRIVLLVLAVLVFVWLLRRALGSRKPDTRQPRSQAPGAATPDLVACAHCGVHLPRSEALAEPGVDAPQVGRFYCCEEHRRVGSR